MMRMFKVTSPMSVGTWVLSATGASTVVAATNAWTGRLPGPARVARPAAAVLGLPLSTYTAALIADTAVPVWHQARWPLPFVFGSGAALTAGAAAVAVTPPQQARPARRLALAAAVVEIAANEAMKRGLGDAGGPYHRGAPRALGHATSACLAAGGALLATRGGRSRPAAAVAGALLCAGALCARVGIVGAGRESASDPAYLVGPQRDRIVRGERMGAARRRPRTAQRASAGQHLIAVGGEERVLLGADLVDVELVEAGLARRRGSPRGARRRRGRTGCRRAAPRSPTGGLLEVLGRGQHLGQLAG